MTASPVRFGIDRVVDSPSILQPAARVGLVTNHSARLAGDVTRAGRVALLDAGVPLVRLFSPEHGLSARGDDGAPMHDAVDPTTGLPVVSLYGDRFAPPDDSLADLDLVLFDVPDVGARFYTYTWTLSHVLESCARTRVPLVVLDRPNPLGGVLSSAEGPRLDEATCASFVGRWSIPIRHALTLGELAMHWAQTRVRGAQLEVMRCEGWSRDQQWPSLALPWVPTSPAMPSFASAQLYPGLCLFEGTNLSVGRGSTIPFQWVGAPWLDAALVIDAMAVNEGDAVTLHAEPLTPTEYPYRGEACVGVRVRVTDAERVRPVALALRLMAAVVRTHRQHFAWSTYPTAANPSGEHHFARLAGVRTIAQPLEDATVRLTPALLAAWTSTGDWDVSVREALLYR